MNTIFKHFIKLGLNKRYMTLAIIFKTYNFETGLYNKKFLL